TSQDHLIEDYTASDLGVAAVQQGVGIYISAASGSTVQRVRIHNVRLFLTGISLSPIYGLGPLFTIAMQTANSGSTTSNIEIHQVHATGIGTLLNVVNGDMTGIAFYDCPGFITAGMAIPAIRGLDNRSGVTSADGAPIKLVDHLLYNFPAKSLFRVSNEI